MSLQKSVQFCAICVQFDAFYAPKSVFTPIYVHSKQYITPYVLGARKALNFESVGSKQTSITLLESSTKSRFVHPLFLLVSKAHGFFDSFEHKATHRYSELINNF